MELVVITFVLVLGIIGGLVLGARPSPGTGRRGRAARPAQEGGAKPEI